MPKRVLVIGAGLGGLSAGIALRRQGYDVEIFEKNSQIGGKLNVFCRDGYTFDLGPSILTLPHIFDRLLEGSGKRLADCVSLRALRPHWRNVFEDGKVIDLYPEPERMAEECRKVGEDPANVRAFLKYSSDLYDLVDSGYFQKGLDTSREFGRFYGLWKFPRFDLFRSMHGGVKRFIKTRPMREIFDYFIKYVGSSPYRAPAFMNCIATIQFRHDLWYVDGGLYGLAKALGDVLGELGIPVHLNSEVTRISTSDGHVSGLVTADERFHPADIVVSNMEVVPAYRRLLGESGRFIEKLEKKLEPSCSGLVIDLGLDRQYPQLAHHNFFYSGDQKSHFRTVFGDRRLPDDPTIYLVAASRTDPAVAPRGCDCLKILPHIPHIEDQRPLTRDDYLACKDRVLEKLERMGLTDLRRHIVLEHVSTPLDIRDQYYSNKGAIYGVVSDRFRNLAFKAPKQSPRLPNLFFVGGSVNPGAGMPMVVLCGLNVARKVIEWDRQ